MGLVGSTNLIRLKTNQKAMIGTTKIQKTSKGTNFRVVYQLEECNG